MPFKVKHYTYFLYYSAFLHTITGCFLSSPVSPFLSVAEKIPFKVKTLCLFPLLYYFLFTISLIAFYCHRYSYFYQLSEKRPLKPSIIPISFIILFSLHNITGCFLLSPVSPFLSAVGKTSFKVKTLCLFPLLYCFSPYYHWLLSIVTGIPIFISCRKNALSINGSFIIRLKFIVIILL